MSNVSKRINIVSIKIVKEYSFQYLARQILSPSNAYEMIKEQLAVLDHLIIGDKVPILHSEYPQLMGKCFVSFKKRIFIKG